MLALSTWYLLVPILKSVKKRNAIITTVLIGLLCGYESGFSNFLALNRTLVFLPFFAIGLVMEKEHLQKLRKEKLKVSAFVVLALSMVAFIVFRDEIASIYKIFYGASPYVKSLKGLAPYGAFIRAGVYLFACIISACLLIVVPNRKVFFSYVGKYSIAVYILHILVRNAMKYAGVFTKIKQYPSETMYLAIPICVLATLFLGNPMFGKALQFIGNPLKPLKNRCRKD